MTRISVEKVALAPESAIDNGKVRMGLRAPIFPTFRLPANVADSGKVRLGFMGPTAAAAYFGRARAAAR